MPRRTSSLTLWRCLTRNRGGRCSRSRMLPTKIGGVYHAGASGESRPRRSSRGYDSRISGFLEWNLQRVTVAAGDSIRRRFRHGECLQEVELPFAEWCTHLYRPQEFGVHFRPGGLRVVRCEDDGAAFEPVESGIGAVDYTIMHIAGDRNC